MGPPEGPTENSETISDSLMPSFYNGKRFFLTYAQCPIGRDYLLEFLRTKAPVRYVLVAEEFHEDGNAHLHACVEFEDKHCKDVRWLDVTWEDKSYHPNKQDPRKWEACKNYTKKYDKDFIELDLHDVWPEEEEREVEMDVQEKCFSFDKEEDWYAYCISNKISFQFCQYFWNRLHRDYCTITDQSIIERKICSALETFNLPGDTRRSIVLRGSSGIGKTTWAKTNAPKPCLFVSHIDQLKMFRPGFHKSIIFDDVSFLHTPRTNQIALVDCDNTRAIHCRHSVATIPAGVAKIFTCNEWPVDKSDEAIARRCRFYTVSGWLNEIKAD